MFKSLTLKNYRSYEDFTFYFHKRINAIIGEGLSGKTNVLRAIRLLNDYRPNNKKYLSHFVPKNSTMEITLKTSENATVKLSKNSKGSIYKTINQGGEKASFRKFGSKVPLEVKKIINLNDINFQFQLDAPYIISNSPGQITKIINGITKVDDIDIWIKQINGLLKAKNTFITVYNEEYKEAKKGIASLKDLKKLEPILKKLNDSKDEMDLLKIKKYKISTLIYDIKKMKVKIKIKDKVILLEQFIDKIKKIQIKKDELVYKMEVFESLLKHEANLKIFKSKLKKIKTRYLDELKKNKQCPTCLSKITSSIIKKIKERL